jgi:single-stranded DNA-binding protein
MAQIIQDPELRYTADNQTPLTQMVVEFPGQKPEDPPTTLKVVGWGNLANEIKENYATGDQVVIEGRLSMNTIDRPEGFKEKRAELTASRLYKIGSSSNFASSAAAPTTIPSSAIPTSKSNNVVVPLRASKSSAANDADLDRNFSTTTADLPRQSTKTQAPPEEPRDLDDIPF